MTIAALTALISPTWTMEGGPPDLPAGRGGLRVLFDHIGGVRQRWMIDDVLAEGDKVVVRATNHCEQDSFFGHPGRGISTVRTDTTGRAAISALVIPDASSRRISTCRSVRLAGFVRVAAAGPRGDRGDAELPQPAPGQRCCGPGAESIEHREGSQRRLRGTRVQQLQSPLLRVADPLPLRRGRPPVAVDPRCASTGEPSASSATASGESAPNATRRSAGSA